MNEIKQTIDTYDKIAQNYFKKQDNKNIKNGGELPRYTIAVYKKGHLQR